MATKKFTLRQVAEALINDKTPKTKDTFFIDQDGNRIAYPSYDGGLEVGASCALGGAAIGLGVFPSDLLQELNDVKCDMGYSRSRIRALLGWGPSAVSLGELIYHINDNTNHTKRYIGERILKECEEFLDVEMEAGEARYRIAEAMKG